MVSQGLLASLDGVVSTHCGSMASSTAARPMSADPNFGVIRMPRRALGSLSVSRRRTDPSQNVLSVRNRLQMPRIYAIAPTAQMIQDESIWDRLAEQLIGDSMGSYGRPLRSDINDAVPARDNSTPSPAFFKRTYFSALQESDRTCVVASYHRGIVPQGGA